MKMRTPSVLAERLAKPAATFAEARAAIGTAVSEITRRSADELVRPREDLCEFDARGMNEIEGRK